MTILVWTFYLMVELCFYTHDFHVTCLQLHKTQLTTIKFFLDSFRKRIPFWLFYLLVELWTTGYLTFSKNRRLWRLVIPQGTTCIFQNNRVLPVLFFESQNRTRFFRKICTEKQQGTTCAFFSLPYKNIFKKKITKKRQSPDFLYWKTTFFFGFFLSLTAPSPCSTTHDLTNSITLESFENIVSATSNNNTSIYSAFLSMMILNMPW